MAAFPNLTSRHVFMAFGFGAISTLIASWASLGLMLGTLPVTLPTSLQETTIATILMAVIVAPFIEEMAKPIGLYFLQAEEKPSFELKEWAFLGAMAGFGFAVVENFLYAATVMSYGTDASLWLLGLRFLLPLHVIATAISGFGFGLWVKTRNAKYFAACIFVSMLLHGLFNLAASLVG
jgi:RsiW-degrading membrane proteinase PrsW (M82 family)